MIYDRHSTTDQIEWILEQIRTADPFKKPRIRVNGVEVKIASLRLRTFAFKGTICTNCGAQAKYFALERDLVMAARHGNYHLNLWGIRPNGDEVLFTHDHILARGLGGKDHISNTQTMCTVCNNEKSLLENPQL